MTSHSTIDLIARAATHGRRTALRHRARVWTYADLLAGAHCVAGALLDDADDLHEARIGCFTEPGAEYVLTQWGIWLAGGVCVPLCPAHPRPELDHVLGDSGASVVVASPNLAARAAEIAADRGLAVLDTAAAAEGDDNAPLPAVDPGRRALILYTSGTTGAPKGVVTTHGILRAQIECLVDAWQWQPNDHIVHALPLHHVHGIVNALCCALWAGATCELLPRFDADAIWRRFAAREATVFMGVPTMYSKLLAAFDAANPGDRARWAAGARAMRLFVSGSAALPVSVLERWREITGHVLLERYGMTEIGMALSNPLDGERRAGSVGTPLPGVEVRPVDGDGSEPAEIEVRGPSVFLEYWNRPEDTDAAFVDGWFRTGDVAVIEDGRYRILGRSSVDILKTGGHKVSALEIEEVLRTHPAIAECSVVGLDDEEWGQRIAAGVVLAPAHELELDGLRAWCRDRLAPYKTPTRLLCLPELPRNALGKVVKPDLARQFTP